MSFITLDFPREVLELNSDGNKGFRRLVKNSDELESYWRGKNGSGNVYFTAYGYRSLTPPRNHRVDYNTQSSGTSCVILIARTSGRKVRMYHLMRCKSRCVPSTST